MSFHSRDSAPAKRDESMSDPSRNTEPDSQPLHAAARINSFFSYFEPTLSRHLPGMGQPGPSRAPISPPPLKRTSSEVPTATGSPGLSAGTSSIIELLPGSDMTKDTTPVPSTASDAGAVLSAPSAAGTSRQGTPRRQNATPTLNKTTTPRAQTRMGSDWTFDKIVERLDTFHQEVKTGHAQLAAYVIESTKATERRKHHGNDLFASVNVEAVPEKKPESMRMKFKQHLKTKKDQREEHYMVTGIKTNKERVPSYRFHHVEIKKNILTPNTMLTFVPHLRDLESSEEVKYNLWLKELEDIDLQSGFKPMSREEKVLLTVHSERAATLSLYLESWLDELAIPGCNKTTLIRYMAQQEPDDAITPQQKNSLLNSHREGDEAAPGADRAARIFTDAFRHVFKDRQAVLKRLELRNVLLLDESVDNIMDSKPTAKDGSSTQNDNEYDLVEKDLATYCILGCVICFSHACEHGEYDAQNCKRTFSMLSGRSRLSDALKRRELPSMNGNGLPNGEDMDFSNCQRKCYLLQFDPDTDCDSPVKPWSDAERTVLRSLFLTANHSKVRKDPICLAAEFLDRACCEVLREFQSMHVVLPELEPEETVRVKNVPWYDRHRKMLLGDWQDHTYSHEFELLQLPEPCYHDGPCVAGCACHSQGKTCQPKQKDKPCICVQLNRECDPELCGSCGVLERADPANATDEWLHSHGCQNCDLQRGSRKALLLGQSQLEGVGYGLFTAEDISQDAFVVEYVGELITHDEGVRREARRGDVFDEEATVSYLFTLLENEGIWVDAAVYGNLSRYINHAMEGEKRGCNIAPRILYVNGEFRIKFTAMRDIKAGEELFFNYGKEFPNLTKKLLDDKAGVKQESGKRKGGRPKRTDAKPAAEKTIKADKSGPKKARRPKKKVVEVGDEEIAESWDSGLKSRKRKRHLQDDSEEEEYHPTGTDGTSHAASESDAESVRPSNGSATRLRKRASQQLRALQQSTPTNRSIQPTKTRGKRGGARPGSGRPRKYPRPVPKATQPEASNGTSVNSIAASVIAAEGIKQGPESVHPPAATIQSFNTTDATTRPGLPAAVTSPASIFNSMRTTASADATAPTAGAANARERSAGSQPSSVYEVFEVLDSEDASQYDDDDEDQDVVIRKRMDRGTRNRRPPAKFRDDDLWN
ncbi:Histone-lysine N-methyltransferase EZH2 [Paramyrothecium foliicola]|nr:Histone-lysine N-methyltransferase EZH2 [Paramyrothecium foliicola]